MAFVLSRRSFLLLGSASIALPLLPGCVTSANWQGTLGEVSSPLERKYLQWGPHKAASFRLDAPGTQAKAYRVWYPEDMARNPGKKYPMVVLVNGTGWHAEKYPYIFEHLASWGFIAAGNMDEWSGNGRSSSETLGFMLREANRRGSLFKGHVDPAGIGVAGHSQGGAGVVNAIGAFPNGKYYRAAYSQSPTHRALARDALKADYDISKVSIPTAIVCMTDTDGLLHDADDGKGSRICGISDMREMKRSIRKAHPKTPVVLFRRSDPRKGHGANLQESEPYLVAWMLWWLAGDEEARNCFFGANPELARNPRWRDVDLR